VRRGRRVGLLTDAFASPELPRAMIRGLRAGRTAELADGGRIVCRPTEALGNLDMNKDMTIAWPGSEQTNSTLLIDRTAVIKLFRRLVPGVHPEAEMSRYLTEHGFTGAPALLGDIIREDPDGTSYAVAIVQRFVENQGDGWVWTLGVLDRILHEATPLPQDQSAAFAPYCTFAETLGRRLGEMHAVLAKADDDPAFAPEPVRASDVETWRAEAATELDKALDLAHGAVDLDDDSKALTETLIGRRRHLADAIDGLLDGAETGLRMRIHGDLHLGQVLVAGADAQIIDFEGEPTKTLALRRAKQSPARDLAGLVRSFDYAAAQAGRNKQSGSAAVDSHAEDLLRRFTTEAERAMLAGYEGGIGNALARPDPRLVDFFALEKAAYEIAYEAANRPDWLGVPLRGLVRLTDRLLAEPLR
jgi:maltose alpha-D-glucosyltransferase/alpha-amylase